MNDDLLKNGSDMFSESNTDEDELYHYGRKGMKWYQNIFTSGKERKARKRRLKNLEKARQAKTDKKILEDEKKKAIESGSAKDVMKFQGKYTPAEMQYITTRLNWERSMKDLQSKEISSGKNAADKVFEKVGKVTDYANTGIKAWNTFANVYNAFTSKDVSLPKIDTNIANGNRDYRKQEKQAAKDKAKKEKQEARKRAIETADYKDIYKNLGKLSVEDLKIASQRSTFESTIKNNWGKDYVKSIEKEYSSNKYDLPNKNLAKTSIKSNNQYNSVIDYGKKYADEKFSKNMTKVNKTEDGNYEFSNITFSSNNPVSVGKDYVLNTLGIDDKK